MNSGIWIEDSYLERGCYETDIMYRWLTEYRGSGIELGHLVYHHTLTVL